MLQIRWMMVIIPLWVGTAFGGENLQHQRQIYKQALSAVGQGESQKFQQLRLILEDYPLAPYLDYYWMRRNPAKLSVASVRQFMLQNNELPLALWMERFYLNYLASQRRWADFLEFYPKEPFSTSLRCYYFRAQWQRGDRGLAMRGAKKLWLSGRSQPKACDPLFTQLEQSGGITQSLIWQRMQLAYEARQWSLVRYLASRQQGPWKQAGQILLQGISHTEKAIARATAYWGVVPSQQLLKSLLIKHQRKDPTEALILWLSLGMEFTFSSADKRKIERAIVYRMLIRNVTSQRLWMDQALLELGDESLYELRIRMALSEQRWLDVLRWIAMLPEDEQQISRWRYWRARALDNLDEPEQARQLWLQLAQLRNFYGFLAAEWTGSQYPLQQQDNPHSTSWESARSRWQALARIDELTKLGRSDLVRSEWNGLLSRQNHSNKLLLASIALDRQWQHLAVQATIKAHAWDLLEFRFPKPMPGMFSRFAKMRDLDVTLLYAMARQESALYQRARSHAGARGLMQLMPATAKQVARKIGFPYRGVSQLYHPEANVRLGSAYLKELLNTFGGNRIFAAAAYNAGPHRVKKWLHRYSDMPLDLWVESIPFRETRHYVQNVLSYNLIYQHLMDRPLQFFNPGERKLFFKAESAVAL
ncbi:transglycosylase SLT domain-containing protein [Dongshaea marina]|uniref:transglycosylase SLT domain-containing protein n=1 Tax=Dongshaea marina TaxID=2047966 RepID=UPI000D3EA75F|nr:transglycosylase SLT domain-containing protein [Dongshaea marina]